MREAVLMLIYDSISTLPQIGVYKSIKVDLDNEKALIRAVRELREGLVVETEPPADGGIKVTPR